MDNIIREQNIGHGLDTHQQTTGQLTADMSILSTLNTLVVVLIQIQTQVLPLVGNLH